MPPYKSKQSLSLSLSLSLFPEQPPRCHLVLRNHAKRRVRGKERKLKLKLSPSVCVSAGTPSFPLYGRLSIPPAYNSVIGYYLQ
ncbi:hypothetical protein VN97_g9544 [Penicillium thymicola]|uniref:Uncharacterized protein n=1 Tax=Penicillium thymicola TaxID=293382 RepID=A0AAI9TBI5_PENTH|nr:hypothetical protein VN97_g9544 [Penicillium thymicola]